jgi:glucose/arabinose dehydrogenase
MNQAIPTFVTATAILLALTAQGFAAGNAQCPGEDVFFNPGNGEDIFVPPGYKVEAFATGLNFPTNIAFRNTGSGFEVFVTEAGDSLPGRCNNEDTYPGMADHNPFLADIAVLDQSGKLLRVLAKADDVANKASASFVHAPTIGVAFESGFSGRMFVSDSRQGIRGALGPRNSSRILEVDPTTGKVTELILNLPTGDHPTEQITVRNGFIYWSQGSATNSGVAGHDNGAAVGGGVDTNTQHEVPCEDVTLSGNNFDSGDGHLSGGFVNHGQSVTAGQVVKAFDGATQPGMCTGAILRASLSNPQSSVEPVSWGYRNPFGIRFAPEDHPLQGALLITENGEDERGARPVNNAPDRIHVHRGDQLDYHGWPDRFGFLESSQTVFVPIGGPSDDNLAAVGKPVLPILMFPPRKVTAPIALEPADIAAVGLDFVPDTFAGAGNTGNMVNRGDALITREGDFGFSPGNGTPEVGHDVERVQFLSANQISQERFAFNCRAADQVTQGGTKICKNPADQAFGELIRGINRPVDGKFGPDGAFYVVDFGAVRDVGRSDPRTKFQMTEDGPLVQIPGTGVIWRISKTGGAAVATGPGGTLSGGVVTNTTNTDQEEVTVSGGGGGPSATSQAAVAERPGQ